MVTVINRTARTHSTQSSWENSPYQIVLREFTVFTILHRLHGDFPETAETPQRLYGDITQTLERFYTGSTKTLQRLYMDSAETP